MLTCDIMRRQGTPAVSCCCQTSVKTVTGSAGGKGRTASASPRLEPADVWSCAAAARDTGENAAGDSFPSGCRRLSSSTERIRSETHQRARHISACTHVGEHLLTELVCLRSAPEYPCCWHHAGCGQQPTSRLPGPPQQPTQRFGTDPATARSWSVTSHPGVVHVSCEQHMHYDDGHSTGDFTC